MLLLIGNPHIFKNRHNGTVGLGPDHDETDKYNILGMSYAVIIPFKQQSNPTQVE